MFSSLFAAARGQGGAENYYGKYATIVWKVQRPRAMRIRPLEKVNFRSGSNQLKITAVKPYTIHPGWRKNLILIKVETDEGIHGWGEAYSQYDRDTAVMA